ncbi:MAG TPA: endonuclease/exonuclease/phosphatase family protein [Amycolatopsis sp.]|uniref:endonuclease/exonuclease/phosphatase family protein n=1 Tax=Amycolatopsis sp. TaxID=37632 RepID=UPI002B4758CD|nr:endonuclease/exonuclease/phosphatase family protein [Amycolatopsis sp.]HKS48476.1 endonuclease/exonuclease/phosphatase family protein [Amycolatopsis sp.]
MIVFAVLAALFVMLAALRLLGIDGNRYTAALIALTPYWTAGGLVLGVLALAMRHWWIGVGVVAVSVALTAALLPRLVPATEPAASGKQLRIMSSNLYLGQADAKSVVQLVRDHGVDVLNMLELTPSEVAEFERAGLFDLLPYRVLEPDSGGAGSGIASRYPLTKLSLTVPSLLAQPSARVDLGGISVEVVAIHPIPPVTSASVWAKEMAELPGPGDSVRILAGDFNATLDHAAFRRLLARGYADAGERRGSGFVPTWPSDSFPPPVTIDHVVVDPRVAVNDYQVLDVPGSDHRAVYARLTLP